MDKSEWQMCEIVWVLQQLIGHTRSHGRSTLHLPLVGDIAADITQVSVTWYNVYYFWSLGVCK